MEVRLDSPPKAGGCSPYSAARLDRLDALLDEPLTEKEVATKRVRLLRYCRQYQISERAAWRELALYAEAGEEAFSDSRSPRRLFDAIERTLRERILKRLLPREGAPTAKELGSLLWLLERFSERVRFLSDLLVEQVVVRERAEASGTPCDAEPYLRWFTNKLFREIDQIASSTTEEPLFRAAACRYESWAMEKLLDEEALP